MSIYDNEPLRREADTTVSLLDMARPAKRKGETTVKSVYL